MALLSVREISQFITLPVAVLIESKTLDGYANIAN